MPREIGTDERAAARAPGPSNSRVSMIDLAYIVGTASFFALMLLYVRACDRLGRNTTDTTERTP